jgi:hypothetical protein
MIRKILAGIVCLITGCKESKDSSSPLAMNEQITQDAWIEELVWRKATDEQNPFDHEVLDCRAVALGFTATTSDKSIAESFNRLRIDDGKSSIGVLPENIFTVESDLRFPYNGVREDGVIFSAREMEDKWDFYAYESRLYIRRSWTGALLHVAELRYTDSEVIVENIHSDRDTVYGDADFARAHVQFLIATHFGSTLLPFPIPPDMPRSERKTIALMGFSSYGRRAQFAHYLKQEGEQDVHGNTH